LFCTEFGAIFVHFDPPTTAGNNRLQMIAVIGKTLAGIGSHTQCEVP
jgi:hypothetical protein